MLYKKIVIYCFFTGLLLACNNNLKNTTNHSENKGLDSIAFWITQGKNTNINISNRKTILSKAYNSLITLPNDSVKAVYFTKLSWASYKLKDSLFFKQVNKKALQLALQLKDSSKLAAAHWDYGSFYNDNGIQDSAYYHALTTYKIYTNIGDSYRAGRVLNLVAGIQADVKDYTGAEISAIKALELLKTSPKYNYIYSSYNMLGIINRNLKEYDKALDFYQKAEEQVNKIEDKIKAEELKLTLLNNIGLVYRDQGYYERAYTNFKKVIATDSLFYTDTRFYAKALNNLTHSRFKLGDTTNLKQQLENILHIRDSIGDTEGAAFTNYNLAEYYLSQKDTLKAYAYAEDAKLYAKKSSNNSRLLKTLELLTLIDSKNATQYTQSYITLNDSLQQEERKIRNKFARIRFETDEFIAENELLSQRQKLLIGIALGILLLSLATYVIIWQRVKNQKLKFEQQQQKSNEEIFNLMLSEQGKLKEGKQQEQKRISQELHDGVLGDMLGIRLMLLGLNNKIEEEAKAKRLKHIKELGDIEEEVRSISHELEQASHEKIHNFINSVKDLILKVSKTGNFSYNFNYDNYIDWDELNSDIKINLYRIIQESIQNCVKHAQAKNINLYFNTTPNYLKVSIVDDGIGFVKNKKKDGIGMKNIASRVQKINGSWAITSKINSGTTITIEIPIDIEQLRIEPDPELEN